jgi:D-methionine transport system ATP-binding protein
MIEVKHINKKFSIGNQSVIALCDVSFSVREGEIFALIGLSGAGKSTALRCLNLIERPDSGSISVNGKELLELNAGDLRRFRGRIGMIFQSFNLLSNRTVAENVAFPLEVAGWKKDAILTRVEETLRVVGLFEKRNHYPSQLSGGQKQRVAIARGIANRPHVLLADEPTSALDPLTKEEVLTCLRDINQKLGVTIVIATHEINVVKRLAQRAVIFNGGRIIEELKVINGEMEAKDEFTKRFLEVA